MHEGSYEEFYNDCFYDRHGDRFEEFDGGFDDEPDPEDEEFIRFLRELAYTHREEEENRLIMVDTVRVKQVIDAYNRLKNTASRTPVKVTVSLFKPIESMGYISVVGGDITFDDPKEFAKIIEHATNVNFYPLVDGSGRLDISFHGLTDELE